MKTSTPSIHPQTKIGAVALTIGNLERSLAFYQANLGFQLHRRAENIAHLGAGGPDLLLLHEQPGAPRPGPRSTGLYHFAILVPSRRHLAQSLRQLAANRTPLQGFADHLVSEAIYLADPDGIGIEIYRDRPRHEWPYEQGKLQMATDPLDLDGLLAEAPPDTAPRPGLDPATTIGHVHLRVSHLPETEQFYRDLLGLELVTRYGAMASFFAAGGYHHHIGTNTWAGVGAPPPPAGAIGLRWYSLDLPDEASLAQLRRRLEEAGIPITPTADGLYLRDPAGNGIIVRSTKNTRLVTK